MGLNIDRILERKGLNRSKLSELLGKKNRSYVTNALKNPTLKTLEDISNVLGVSVRDLFDDDSERTAEELINEAEGLLNKLKDKI